MERWFHRLSTMNTILLCVVVNIIGAAFIYMRFTGAIPIGAFVGIGIFAETAILVYKKYIKNEFGDDNEDKRPQISDEVAEAMANQIVREAEQHRKEREEEE
jgi:hypothetical protein|tara:strand:+ start:165 stop:470 length:306 start_codon:yes stop_codon:yes gene_type:complete